MIKQKLKEEHDCPEIDKFLNYFDNFFVGSNKKPLFSIENWSTHERVLLNIPTTSNCAEIWNRWLKYTVRNPHPCLNFVLKELRTLDFLSSFDICKRLVSFEYISLSDKQ
jgi:hypothetical protein